MKKNTITMNPFMVVVVAATATKPLPGIPLTITGSHKGIAIAIMEAGAGKSFRLSCRHCCSSVPSW